jgi:hypothetical protein
MLSATRREARHTSMTAMSIAKASARTRPWVRPHYAIRKNIS